MPKHGHLYHLRGEGRAGASMRQYADAWTAMALIRGKNVHWIDGACRFNPTKILQCVPSSFPEPEQLLHQIFVSRGFTVHQLASMIQRLSHELHITKAEFVVIDGPISMHLDEQINDYEARTLWRRGLETLLKIAQNHQIPVVMITNKNPISKRHQQLLIMAKNRVSESLSGKWILDGKTRRMWLLHLPSRRVGFQMPHHLSLSNFDDSQPSLDGAE